MLLSVNQKAQVSLEYILITLSVVVVLSLIVIQASILYSKNINQIDNRNLKDAYEKIQGNIDISELLENYLEEITLLPKSKWSFEKINNYKYRVFNEDKEYFIESNYKINTNIKSIEKEEIIIIKKENKKIYIETK
jgi:hypothetical protein